MSTAIRVLWWLASGKFGGEYWPSAGRESIPCLVAKTSYCCACVCQLPRGHDGQHEDAHGEKWSHARYIGKEEIDFAEVD